MPCTLPRKGDVVMTTRPTRTMFDTAIEPGRLFVVMQRCLKGDEFLVVNDRTFGSRWGVHYIPLKDCERV